jgi:NhaP-type Na+/H+ or K+/H+ antiporter
MGGLVETVRHMPPWLIFVFIFLVLHLARYARPRWVPIWSLRALPVLFVTAAAAGLIVHPPLETLAWVSCVAVVGPAGWLSAPEPLAIDPRKKRLKIPGSVWSAVRLICLVSSRYAAALATMHHSDDPGLMQVFTGGFSGCVAGFYIGHSLRLLQTVRGI